MMPDTKCFQLQEEKTMLRKLIGTMSFFSSISTLLCCALPALLVSLGLGTTLVSLVSNFSQLIWVSEHKGIVFIVAGVMLLIAGVVRHFSRNECPTDQQRATCCADLKQGGSIIFIASIVFYVIGAFFAFIAPLLVYL